MGFEGPHRANETPSQGSFRGFVRVGLLEAQGRHGEEGRPGEGSWRILGSDGSHLAKATMVTQRLLL